MLETKEHEVLFKIEEAPVIKVTSSRIKQEERQEGLHYYDIRHSDDDWGEPATIEKVVFVNYYGTIVTTKPIPSLEVETKNNEHAYIIPDDELIQLIFDHES